MALTKNSFLATMPDIKQVAPSEMPFDSSAGILPLCEVTFHQPVFGFRSGETCITDLTCGNIIKRNGLNVTLKLIPGNKAVKKTFTCAIRGQCNKIIWARLNELPAEVQCRPPRAKESE